MLSVEKRHPDFARFCRSLQVGESAYSGHAEIPYDLHRYRDGWHVYWKSPPDGQIGRRLRSLRQLNAFLGGDWNVGFALRSPKVRL